jgi:membrane dipeptidase
MPSITRRKLLIGGTGLALSGIGAGYFLSSKKAPLGFEPSVELLTAGKNFLENHVSIDIHAHPGRSFVADAEDMGIQMRAYAATSLFEARAIQDMKKGGLTAATFATVSDFQLLQFGENGISAAREFKEGEAWRSYLSQKARIMSLVDNESVTLIKSPSDITTAKEEKHLGVLFTAEGGDFMDGSLEKLKQSFEDGLRSVTLVHYHINEIGDIQTEAPQHNGLTKFGAKVVKTMNAQGMIIDLAHASKDTALDVLKVTDKPVMVSHTAIQREGFTSARFIDVDLAEIVVEGGGLIGAWPAGIGLSSLSDYVDQILHLVDEVGIDHVSIGSDMDANYKPVFDTYETLPVIAGLLLERGMNPEETSKILGGNFMTLFKIVSS